MLEEHEDHATKNGKNTQALGTTVSGISSFHVNAWSCQNFKPNRHSNRLPEDVVCSRDDDLLDFHFEYGTVCRTDLSTSHVTSTTAACSDDDGDNVGIDISSVDIHTSILNVTEDDCDEDDFNDDNSREVSFLDDRSDSYLDLSVTMPFEIEDAEGDDFGTEVCQSKMFPPQEACTRLQLPHQDQVACFIPSASTSENSLKMSISSPSSTIIDHMDRFFDRLCIAESDDDVSYALPCSNERTLYASLGCGEYRGLVPTDLNRAGLVQWHDEQQKKRHRHVSLLQRRARVDRLLADRGRRQGSVALRRVKSEVVQQCSRDTHGRSHRQRPLARTVWDPCLGWSRGYPRILPMTVSSNEDTDTGYDSDPCLSHSKPLVTEHSPSPMSAPAHRDAGESSNQSSSDLYITAQDSLNKTWSLLWMHKNQPIQVQVWIERGVLLQGNAAMVEPCLMWRRSQSAFHSNFAAPLAGSIRLLQISRIVELPAVLGESRDCMCRRGASWVVHTIAGGAFTFSAASVAVRDEIVHQWKCTVARLATLAVLDDAPTILDEFFREPPPPCGYS
jgi:hypothetical protein